MNSKNILLGIITFMKNIFDGALNVWAFLTSELGVGQWTFTPLDILIVGLGVLITALLVKKLVPLA